MMSHPLCRTFLFGVLSLMLLASPSWAAKPNALTLYNRYTFYPARSGLETMNAIFDHQLISWLYGEVGGRWGESAGHLAQLNYKAELQTANFLDYFSVLGRLSKINNYYPTTPKTSVWMLQLVGQYPLGDFKLSGVFGVVDAVGSRLSSATVPTFSGAPSWGVSYLLGAKYHTQGSRQAYSLKFANYDVFDVYPANQPFFQADIDHEFSGFTVFGYVRYRFQDFVNHPYATYVTLGVVIPFGENESRARRFAPHPGAPRAPVSSAPPHKGRSR